MLDAAKHGLKLSQARVGYLYLTGLGDVPRDSEAAIGWLGVAAEGQSNAEIRNYYAELKAQVPEALLPKMAATVVSYEAAYGTKVNRVNCNRRRPTGSHVKGLRCRFKDADWWQGSYQVGQNHYAAWGYPGAFYQ